MGASNDLSSWQQHFARIFAQVDELRVWLDTEQRALCHNLDTQIAQLQSEIETLETEVMAGSAYESANRVAAEIETLTAKGDAVYNLLLTSMAQSN